MTSDDLLFELGCEELPPKSLLMLSQVLLTNTLNILDEKGLHYEQTQAYATPRRLAFIIKNLSATQADKHVERKGPSITAALTQDGLPSRAALGFAKSCGVDFDALARLKTDKGEWLLFKQIVTGKTVIALIPDIIRQSIQSLPINKKMRWGASNTEFVRPVHWAVLLYGHQLIEAKILGVNTTQQSRGHRFHAPEKITIDSPETYVTTLLTQGKVRVDIAQRQAFIKKSAEEAALNRGGIAYINDSLLEEITALNEFPVVMTGNFNPRFLTLPKEVLMTAMQSHQKYFPVMNATGDLLPHFITFSNIDSTHIDSIRKGNERVISPRLADAEFFWDQDRTQPLSAYIERLSTIIFQQKLGTLAHKTQRLQTLARYLAAELNADTQLAERAALLAKTDLMTQMVSEFPSLQGIMGRYYALADGESAEVAHALEEQYFPKKSGSKIPASVIGQLLSLADKVDTLTGIFSVGLSPTGDKDPYGLRRACLGLLRIIIENQLRLDLVELINISLQQYTHDFERLHIQQQIIAFVFERLKGYCLEQGFKADEIEAVMSIKPTQPLDFIHRLKAVQLFRQHPDAQSLTSANKRISNILKKTQTTPTDTIGPLQLPQEHALYACACTTATAITPLLKKHHYAAALSELAQLKQPIDHFFDHVMVNCDDLVLRANRLALLKLLSQQFLKIADISKLHA